MKDTAFECTAVDEISIGLKFWKRMTTGLLELQSDVQLDWMLKDNRTGLAVTSTEDWFKALPPTALNTLGFSATTDKYWPIEAFTLPLGTDIEVDWLISKDFDSDVCGVEMILYRGEFSGFDSVIFELSST